MELRTVILKENFDTLMTYRPKLMEYLQKKWQERKSEEDWEWERVQTVSGSFGGFIHKGEEIYRINSLYNPEHEAMIWAKQYSYKEHLMRICMFGIGNGIFIREIEKGLKAGDLLIVYEPSVVLLCKIMMQEDISDLLKNTQVILFVGEELEQEMITFVKRQYGKENIHSLSVLANPEYDRIFYTEWERFQHAIWQMKVQLEASRNCMVTDGEEIIKNTYYNVKHLQYAYTTSDICGKIAADIPVIIVGAGPSLEKNIDMLKKAEGRAVIIALTRNLKKLYEHNIKVDMVAVVDPVAYEETFYYGGEEESLPLLCHLQAKPYFLEVCKNKLVFATEDYYMMKLANRLNRTFPFLKSGGSVATMAFSAAREMGFKTFILVGQDLAYDGMRSHCDDMDGESQEFLTEREDIYGNMVRVRQDWYIYLQWYEEMIAQMKDCQVIDATEGGARIKGTSVMTLQDAIERYCQKTYDMDALFESMTPSFSKEEYRQIVQYVDKQWEETMEIGIQLERAIDILQTCLRDMKKEEQLLKQLSIINDRISSCTIYEYLNMFVEKYMSESNWENEKNEQKAMLLETLDTYKAFQKANHFLKKAIEESGCMKEKEEILHGE